jgi:hypothetical protein|tara:strand:+ start:389 stop:508 length:120 start_codon:yes stop_codon:yes gene_type:complete
MYLCVQGGRFESKPNKKIVEGKGGDTCSAKESRQNSEGS